MNKLESNMCAVCGKEIFAYEGATEDSDWWHPSRDPSDVADHKATPANLASSR